MTGNVSNENLSSNIIMELDADALDDVNGGWRHRPVMKMSKILDKHPEITTWKQYHELVKKEYSHWLVVGDPLTWDRLSKDDN